jgi:hypothetical protein
MTVIMKARAVLAVAVLSLFAAKQVCAACQGAPLAAVTSLGTLPAVRRNSHWRHTACARSRTSCNGNPSFQVVAEDTSASIQLVTFQTQVGEAPLAGSPACARAHAARTITAARVRTSHRPHAASTPIPPLPLPLGLRWQYQQLWLFDRVGRLQCRLHDV